eukprot:scaffold59901_cov28-Attheya_sp.AAC.1
MKWCIETVTSGRELLIATRGARQWRRKTKKGRKGTELRSRCYPLSYVIASTVPIILATALYVRNLHTRNALPFTTYVPFVPVRKDCAKATHSWMETGIRHK